MVEESFYYYCLPKFSNEIRHIAKRTTIIQRIDYCYLQSGYLHLSADAQKFACKPDLFGEQ